MEEKYLKYLRYFLFSLGGIFLILFILNIIEIMQILSSQSILDIESIKILPLIIYFIIFYICFKIAFNWENLFKSLTKTFISIGIVFLTLFFLLLPISNYSNEIVGSIQPTIDTVLVSSIDEILEEQFPIENSQIEISLAQNSQILNIDNSNLSKDDVKLISEVFELNEKSDLEKEIFVKIFVTIVYEELSKTPESLETAIPLEQIRSTLEDQVDLELLKNIDVSMLESFYSPNENAKINILISENSVIRTVNPDNLNEEDVNLIWENLNLENNVSIQTKEKIISLILSQALLELEKQNLEIVIPIASIGSMIPEEIKPMFSYDFFSNNTQIRIKALKSLRNDCKINSNEYNDQICEGIEISEYDNLMSSLEEITTENDVILPFDISKVFEPILTKKKIQNKLENINSLAYKFFIGYLILIFISFLTYFLHFKLFNRELINIHIPYYIAKINLISYIFNFVILVLIYLFINEDYFFSLTKNFSNQTQIIDLNLLINLPIFEVIKLINSQMLFYGIVYLIISILAYGIFYFLQKEKLKNIDLEALKNSKNENNLN